MAYEKTVWNNDGTPAIDADNLNKIEQGIADSIRRDGDTMKAPLKLCGEYENNNDAVDKGYVDSLIDTGYFHSDSDSKTIKLPFKPKAVFVIAEDLSSNYEPWYLYWNFAFATQGRPQKSRYNKVDKILTLNDNSFTIQNFDKRSYKYIAFR